MSTVSNRDFSVKVARHKSEIKVVEKSKAVAGSGLSDIASGGEAGAKDLTSAENIDDVGGNDLGTCGGGIPTHYIAGGYVS